MELVVLPSAQAAADLTAQIIAEAIQEKPDLVLGLATGRTMEDVYARLVRRHCEQGLDFSAVRTFNLDEYVGLSGNDGNSFRHYMHSRLFRHVNLRPENTNIPDGAAPDADAESERYERSIAACGGIDLQLLGIGQNGHIGFNEPLCSASSRTRVTTLTPETRQQNAPLFGSLDRVPHRAITMGLGTILDARRCLLLATGEGKAAIVAEAVEGPMTPAVPASTLQRHPCCTAILDADTASQLTNRASLGRKFRDAR